METSYETQQSRTLHECVDWNCGYERSCGRSMWSHPTRVRGLKRWYRTLVVSFGSHPTRVRGLKLNPYRVILLIGDLTSHPTRVRGLKLLIALQTRSMLFRRIPHGCLMKRWLVLIIEVKANKDRSSNCSIQKKKCEPEASIKTLGDPHQNWCYIVQLFFVW